MAGDLPHRPGPVRLIRDRAGATLRAAPPEALFVVSAAAQYTGAVIAVGLFDDMSPATVAWLRVLFAGLVIVAVAPRAARGPWSRRDLAWVAAFGTATAAMNMLFYLGIDRMPLGTGVTIEFIGPVAVAAARTRSRRNTFALLLAAVGVAVLGGAVGGDDPVALVFILGASAMWAGYIVAGSRVALADRGVAGLGVGLVVGAVVLAPFGTSDLDVALGAPSLLAACALVGVLSNALGYGIDQFTLRRIPVRRFSVLLALLPVCASLFGLAFLGQVPTRLDVVGMALVLAGVAVQEREVIERHHHETATT